MADRLILSDPADDAPTPKLIPTGLLPKVNGQKLIPLTVIDPATGQAQHSLTPEQLMDVLNAVHAQNNPGQMNLPGADMFRAVAQGLAGKGLLPSTGTQNAYGGVRN